jgi:hypothetical protein
MQWVGYKRFCYPVLLVLITSSALRMAAQNDQPSATASAKSVNASLDELQTEVRELKQMVLQLQQQTVESRAEISHLRQQLQADRGDNSLTASSAAPADELAPPHASSSVQLSQRLERIEEDQQLLSGKINEQYQTKVESASKYRVRLSGIVLFNLFGNSGSVDNLDVPTWATGPGALATSGAVGGTLRQSILGLEVFGPDLMGAHASGNINFDFGGGFAQTDNGVNSGVVRLRTGVVRLDWQHSSLIAGQDQFFLSPNSPTSYASLIVPPLSYAGNLWSWTPQVRVEHRIPLSNDSTVTLQGGFLDNLVGEPPYDPFYRTPQAGEASRQPAYAGRVSYAHQLLGQNFTVGAGGYYSRENWGFNRNEKGWAGTLDWLLPLDRWFSLSGALYRGAAIGGLGAALGRSVLYSGSIDDPTTLILPVNSVGGWAQLKFRLNPKLEFNGAFGQDNPFAADIRRFDNAQSYSDPTVTRNRSAFGNVIYRPRSDLLFSLEYRRIRTFSIYDYSDQANQVNLSMGILF